MCLLAQYALRWQGPQHRLPVLRCAALQHGLQVHSGPADSEEMADACSACLPASRCAGRKLLAAGRLYEAATALLQPAEVCSSSARLDLARKSVEQSSLDVTGLISTVL